MDSKSTVIRSDLYAILDRIRGKFFFGQPSQFWGFRTTSYISINLGFKGKIDLRQNVGWVRCPALSRDLNLVNESVLTAVHRRPSCINITSTLADLFNTID